MDKLFLCLANSYKHDNRCIAGVEVERTRTSYKLIKDSWNHPIWFRPINRWTDAGAIPNDEAEDITLFDVVCATNVEECPDGAQTENYYYDELNTIGQLYITEQLLSDLSNTNRRVPFGNTFASVSHEKYEQLDYSIFMIHTEEVLCYLKERIDKRPQPRIKFKYKEYTYDFPVTDPNFRHKMEDCLTDANSFQDYYLVLSLGVDFDGGHYKLIAGVITKDDSCSHSTVLTELSNTVRETYILYQRGLDITQIAQKRGLVTGTISNHISQCISIGLIDINDVVSADIIHRVSPYIQRHPNEKLRTIYEAFDGDISYDDIRLIQASLQ